MPLYRRFRAMPIEPHWLGLERPDGTQPDMACVEFEPVTFRLERNGATFHD